MKIVKLLLIVLLSALAVTIAAAKGIFPTVIITDTASGEIIELSPEHDDRLTQFFLFDWCTKQPAPDLIPENGYEIARGGIDKGEFEPFDKLIYYPSDDHTRGLIHYIGLVNAEGEKDGWSEYDGHWFNANPQTEPYLRQLLLDEPFIESPFRQGVIKLLMRPC